MTHTMHSCHAPPPPRYKLLSEYSKLLRYTPSKQGGKYGSYWVPVDQFLDKEAREFMDGKWHNTFKFTP